jgi:non-lysosomal glucosylceramidase
MLNIREHEHQELFFGAADLSRPLDLRIPSPLGALGYYFYVRVPRSRVGLLREVSLRYDLVGLHESHGDVAPGENAATPRTVPAREKGAVWACLFRAPLARGTGKVVFHGWPAALRRVDLLLCTYPRFMTSGQAEEWIAAQRDPLWAATGVPLGGTGCGRVDICRDGRFRNFTMNNNQDAPIENADGLPGAYLAVTVGGRTIDLASRPIVPGHVACRRLEFLPRFPRAELKAPALAPGLDVSVTLSGPFAPHDDRYSGMPGFLVRWRVSSASRREQTVVCRMGWPNLIGIGGGIAKLESGTGFGDGTYQTWDDPTGRREQRITVPGALAVRYTGRPKIGGAAVRGEHLLAVARQPGAAVQSAAGKGHGEVSCTLTIPAGGTATADMALVACMPDWVDSLGVVRGHAWQNHFASARSILATMLAEREAIWAAGGALAEHLDDSDLPAWLRRRLSNCLYPLVTNSVHYRDGRFSVNEGPTEMSGCYGTIDQRLAAHPATQLFRPDLNARELASFAAIQGKEGGIQHDFGGGHLERGPGESKWPDLTCSFILQTARHAWSTGDKAFERKIWPHARRALLRHAGWAEAGGGVVQVGKNGFGTSYDSYHYIGTTAYIGTLWLAALAVMDRWAVRMGDAALRKRMAGWQRAARRRLDADLWNGKFFRAYADREGARRETCHAGQLAGQVFARMLTGGDVLPANRLLPAIDAVLRINGSARYAIPPDEAEAHGGAAADYGWLPYVEGFMLSAVATVGDKRLWKVWERMIRRMDDDAHPCDTRLMYHPDSGEPSWGACYMTAPASWLVYDAWLGFACEPGEGLLRLAPASPGRYPVVHPLFWGTVEEAGNGRSVLTVRRVFGKGVWRIGTIATRSQRIRLRRPVALVPGAVIEWRTARGRSKRFSL